MAIELSHLEILRADALGSARTVQISDIRLLRIVSWVDLSAKE
jgi:hypothetical protein